MIFLILGDVKYTRLLGAIAGLVLVILSILYFIVVWFTPWCTFVTVLDLIYGLALMFLEGSLLVEARLPVVGIATEMSLNISPLIKCIVYVVVSVLLWALCFTFLSFLSHGLALSCGLMYGFHWIQQRRGVGEPPAAAPASGAATPGGGGPPPPYPGGAKTAPYP